MPIKKEADKLIALNGESRGANIKVYLDFKDEDIERMGSAVVKFSPLMKIFMKYF